MSNHDKEKEDIRITNESLIDYGLDAISKMTAVAEDTEHPRAYEVLGKLIKDIADINNSRLDNRKKYKEIEKIEKSGNQELPPGQQPQFIALTTEELLRSLQDTKKTEKDITPKDE